MRRGRLCQMVVSFVRHRAVARGATRSFISGKAPLSVIHCKTDNGQSGEAMPRSQRASEAAWQERVREERVDDGEMGEDVRQCRRTRSRS